MHNRGGLEAHAVFSWHNEEDAQRHTLYAGDASVWSCITFLGSVVFIWMPG